LSSSESGRVRLELSAAVRTELAHEISQQPLALGFAEVAVRLALLQDPESAVVAGLELVVLLVAELGPELHDLAARTSTTTISIRRIVETSRWLPLALVRLTTEAVRRHGSGRGRRVIDGRRAVAQTAVASPRSRLVDVHVTVIVVRCCCRRGIALARWAGGS
jgi:hypothetical protein